MNPKTCTFLVLFLFSIQAALAAQDTFDISDCQNTELMLNEEICEALNEANADPEDILAMWAQGDDKIEDKMVIIDYWNNIVQPEGTTPDGAQEQPIMFKGEQVGTSWVLTAAASPSYKFNNITYVPEEFEILTWYHYDELDLPNEKKYEGDDCTTKFKDWTDNTKLKINGAEIPIQNKIAKYKSLEAKAESVLDVKYIGKAEIYTLQPDCSGGKKPCPEVCTYTRTDYVEATANPIHEIKNIQFYSEYEPTATLTQFTSVKGTEEPLLIANIEAEQYTLNTEHSEVFSSNISYNLKSRASPYNALYIEKVPSKRTYYVDNAQVKKRTNTSIHTRTNTKEASLTVHHPFKNIPIQTQVHQEEFPTIEITTDKYRYDVGDTIKVDIQTNQPHLPVTVSHCTQTENTFNPVFNIEKCGTIEVDIAGITQSERIAITKSLTPILSFAVSIIILIFLGKTVHHILRRQAL